MSIIDRRFLVATWDVIGAVLDDDTLVLAVAVDTEKVEVNAPSPSAVDTGSDPADVIRAGADHIGGKSNANLLLFSFPDIIFRLSFRNLGNLNLT